MKYKAQMHKDRIQWLKNKIEHPKKKISSAVQYTENTVSEVSVPLRACVLKYIFGVLFGGIAGF